MKRSAASPAAQLGSQTRVLRCPVWLKAPWHLAWGAARLDGISWSDKWGLARLNRALARLPRQGDVPAELDRLTVRQWLDSLGQSRRLQQRLFDPIALGALNDDPEVAAATGLAQVFREAFLSGAEAGRPGLARVGLSELYTEQARRFIESRGGEIALSCRAARIDENGGRVSSVVCENGARYESKTVISALPPWDLTKLDLPEQARGSWSGLKSAPIISVCLWLDRPILGERSFVGLLGTEIQWVFSKSRIFGLNGDGEYLSLVISGAHRHIGKSPPELLEIARRDLRRCLPSFAQARIIRWKVIKEPFATLSPVPGSDSLRPGPVSGLHGLYFAGDWTRTGLPATIESAVLSGFRAAEAVLA